MDTQGIPPTAESRRPDQAGDDELNIREILTVLRQRKRIVIIIFIAVMVLTVAATFLMKPVYEAQDMLLVATGNKGFGGGGQEEIPLMENFMSMDVQRTIETQVEIIKSPPILEETIEKEDFRDGRGNLYGVKDFLRLIRVESKRNVNIITIKVQYTDPRKAAAIANRLADIYIERSKAINQEVASAARKFVENQVNIAARNLDRTEMALRRFKERSGIANFSEEIKEKISRTAELESQVIKARADLKSTRARLGEVSEQIKRSDPTFVSATTVSNNLVVVEQQKRLAELETKRAGLLEELGPKNPDVISVENQIKNVKESIKGSMADVVSSKVKSANPIYQKLYTDYAELQASVFGFDSTVQALEGTLEESRREFSRLPGKEQNLANLERTREVASKTYMMLIEKLQDLKIAEASKVGSARILESAKESPREPARPVKPRKKQNLMMGALLGLFLGCLGAFGLEYLDDTIKSQEALEGLSHLPTLGMVPLLKKEELENLMAGEEAELSAGTGDSFRLLRSNVRFFALDRPLKTLMVTSSIPSEGKSTLTARLAVTIALSDRKVLLIDCDLRNPSSHKLFKLSRTPGLSNILVEDLGTREAIRPTGIPNLDIITGGVISPNPVELLESHKMHALIDELKERYDYLIFDTPPVGTLPDAVVLSTALDGVLLVVAAGSTPRGALQRTIRTLSFSKSRILGTVLNKIDYKKHGDYYYYYYYNYDYSRGEQAKPPGHGKKRKPRS